MNPATADKALAELCEIYWYPVYAFIRRSGMSADDAMDHTQDFFLTILSRGDFAKADPALGKLRSYLLGAVKHHLGKARDKAHALKRGGGAIVVSIDEIQAEQRYALEPADVATPEKLYERRWAMTIMGNAMQSLRDSHERRGKQAEFDILLPFLPWNSGEDYNAAAAALKVTTATATVKVKRLRQNLHKALVAELDQTVSDENEILEELRFLSAAFS